MVWLMIKLFFLKRGTNMEKEVTTNTASNAAHAIVNDKNASVPLENFTPTNPPTMNNPNTGGRRTMEEEEQWRKKNNGGRSENR